MRPALCLTATVGAALMVATPVGPAPGMDRRIVELAANPIDSYLDLVSNTLTNLGTIGTHWLADPLPTLLQLVANWTGYLETTTTTLFDGGQSFLAGLANLPGQLQTLFDAVTTGDVEAAISMLIITFLSANPIPAMVDRLLGIPYDIAGNAMNAALAALHAAQVPIGAAALDAVRATFAEIGQVAQSFVDELQAGDLAAAFAQLIAAPAQILNATLNSELPGLPGLLTPFEDLSQTGFVDAVVNFLPRSVAHAIGAPGSPDGDDSDVMTDVPPAHLDADTALGPIATAAMLSDAAPY